MWGTTFGVLPLLVARRAELLNWLARFFAGLCLIANGAYIGSGCFVGDPNGADDAHELLRHGAAGWHLVTFGGVAVIAGFILWHSLGPRAGFGRAASLAGWKTIAALGMLVIGLLALGGLLSRAG